MNVMSTVRNLIFNWNKCKNALSDKMYGALVDNVTYNLCMRARLCGTAIEIHCGKSQKPKSVPLILYKNFKIPWFSKSFPLWPAKSVKFKINFFINLAIHFFFFSICILLFKQRFLCMLIFVDWIIISGVGVHILHNLTNIFNKNLF